jgi:Fur family transcriptional regulator, ferric uptake regulator
MPQTKSARTVYATATRRAILDLLKHKQRYLTAAVIYAALRPSIPKLALSTIYRTLDLLTELGTISSRTEGSGEASYVFCTTEHHHHALCTLCGHVDDVDCAAMEQFKATLLANQSFLLDEHSIEFFGRCARCR